jgi:hypothetical protein
MVENTVWDASRASRPRRSFHVSGFTPERRLEQYFFARVGANTSIPAGLGCIIASEGSIMTFISKEMESILKNPKAARAVNQAIDRGEVAHVEAADGKKYYVFTNQSAHRVKAKKK